MEQTEVFRLGRAISQGEGKTLHLNFMKKYICVVAHLTTHTLGILFEESVFHCFMVYISSIALSNNGIVLGNLVWKTAAIWQVSSLQNINVVQGQVKVLYK